MSKVEIYVYCILILDVLIIGYYMGTLDERTTTSHAERLVYLILGIGLGMPIYGRVFGWW